MYTLQSRFPFEICIMSFSKIIDDVFCLINASSIQPLKLVTDRCVLSLLSYIGGQWAVVDSCKGITQTECDLTALINDYRAYYKVKVELLTEDGDSKKLESPLKKFALTSGKHRNVRLV